MSGIAERLAEVLDCTARCYPATRGGKHSTGCQGRRLLQAQALLPVVEREIAAARGEAWEEGAHAGRTHQQALTQHAHWSHIGKRVPEPIRNPYRAALSPDPDRGEDLCVCDYGLQGQAHVAGDGGCITVPDRGEGEVGSSRSDHKPEVGPVLDLSRMGYGVCPKCHEDKFIGHGPLCWECFTGRCDSVLVLRHGSAACDLPAGHDQPHSQDASGRTWTTEQAAASAEDET